MNTGETDLDQLRSGLLGVDGYDTLVDDYADSSYAFGEMASLLDTVVAVYLLLSAAMAVVVLLNLYLMFVAEKKRELIVLMICGYSVGDAKAYIYRDSTALTVVGIVPGAVFGTVMGRVTVKALEPSYGFFLRDVSWLAVGAGVVGAGVFSALRSFTGVLRGWLRIARSPGMFFAESGEEVWFWGRGLPESRPSTCASAVDC